MKKRAIILANGNYPRKSEFEFFKRVGFDRLICADGGANSAFKLKLTPDYILGDFDSIEGEVLDYYEKKSKIIRMSSQYTTDVEKCLNFSIKNKIEEVVLLGATGDRLDHSICNIGIVLKYFSKVRIFILHQKTLLAAYEGEIDLATTPGEIISIYGIEKRTRITSKGLKYRLRDVALPLGVRESTSNVARGKSVNLKIRSGRVFVIREFSELKRNGFFLDS
jgi:thiamine pyrophosphokinase